MIAKVFCLILGHTWIIKKRVKASAGYSYYQYTCSCCGETKEEL